MCVSRVIVVIRLTIFELWLVRQVLDGRTLEELVDLSGMDGEALRAQVEGVVERFLAVGPWAREPWEPGEPQDPVQ